MIPLISYGAGLGRGSIAPLGVNEPASITFTVNATEDASFTNGVKFTLEDVVVGGTDDKGDPLVYESVSVTLPNNLTMATSFSLPTDWTCIQSGGSTTIWTILNPETSGTKAIVEDFLTNTYAARLTSRASATGVEAYDFPDNEETIAVEVSTREPLPSWTDPTNGREHYYEQVDDYSGLTWLEAYNAAKAHTYNGLQGYLITLTSQEEQDFILNTMSFRLRTWWGGTRAVHSSNKAKILDEASVSEDINDFDLELTYGNKWYWASGPEAGLVFYDKASVYDVGAGEVSGVFSHWASGHPNTDVATFGGRPAFLGSQTFLSLGSDEWNSVEHQRYSYYVVEYGGYSGQTSVHGPGWNEAPVPQPVIALHQDDLSGLTLNEDVLYIGKIGEPYLTQPITPPPAHYYAGVDPGSAPAAGTFTSEKQWVVLIYDNTYPVVYDPNSANAEGQMSDDTVRHGEDFMLDGNNYTLQGYTFEGWNTEPDGSGDFYPENHEFTPWQFTNALTLYAQWSPAGNGGTLTFEIDAAENAAATNGFSFTLDNAVVDGTDANGDPLTYGSVSVT
ncbi:MAG: InlB B-repeat-containing protein, partial [Coriobacteriales bacterium]|nr:InlB B-repeat-containing protein [Coriobacteriales bacterium]